MSTRTPRAGGGWKAIGYSLKLARRVGWLRMWKAMRSKNSCKTCALGMGGQLGGMVNEGGYFPEVCKKSFQAMASDMQGAIRPEFISGTSLSQLRGMTSRQLEHAGRLKYPLLHRRGETHYRPVSWEDAMQLVCQSMSQSGPHRSFFYASGRSSNEAGFLLQLLARMWGTNYVNNCSFYCHQASGVGLGMSLGSGTGTVTLEDLDHVDLYILIGANPASNHPRLMRSLMQIRRRGGRVLVINPLKERGLVEFKVPSDVRSLLFGTRIASDYVQPHIGGDLALLMGVAKVILERGAQDRSFIEQCTEGFGEFEAVVRAATWEELLLSSGVERETIDRLADQYLSAKNVVIGWCMGITHHLHGTDNVRMIANLALLRGMVGRPHAGLMPIRGHSNVQGMGSVGVTPTLKQALLERFEARLGIRVPTSPGYDTLACLQAAHRKEMSFALCLGGNLYGSNPDPRWAAEAFQQLQTVVYLSTTLNTGHAWGQGETTLILPVLPRDEEPEPTTQESMFSYVRLSDGGPPRMSGPRSEVAVLSEVGRHVLPPQPRLEWDRLQRHADIRALISELIPGYEGLGRIDETRREFHVPGRRIIDGQFPTPSGKARFQAVAVPQWQPAENQLRLMTLRSEGQFNSVVYDEEDYYRGQERRDVILMHPEDIRRLGLQVDQRVKVTSATGELRAILVREFDVRAGNAAMYYPEANVLISTEVDPLSKTPGFKSTLVTVEPESIG